MNNFKKIEDINRIVIIFKALKVLIIIFIVNLMLFIQYISKKAKNIRK